MVSHKRIRGFIVWVLMLLVVVIFIVTIGVIFLIVAVNGHTNVAIDVVTVISIGFTAMATIIIAIASIQYAYPKPKIFAYLREAKEVVANGVIKEKNALLGIFVENAGRGAAWDGKIKIYSPDGKELWSDGFTRLYPTWVYEYPTDDDLPINESVKKHKEIKVEIDYKDEEEEKYHYEITISIREDVLRRFNEIQK